MSYLLAIDQGTTSSRAIAFDRTGQAAALAQREFTQHFPRPGWVEHDANEIWSTQLAVAREVVAAMGSTPHAIGITNQRETTVLWDRHSGEPLARAIVWQDRRTVEHCERLKASGAHQTLEERTGLVLDAYFSGTKLAWLLDQIPGAGQVMEAASVSAELARRMAATGNFNKLQHAREQSFQADATVNLARAQQWQRASRERLTRLMGLWGEQIAFRLPERLPDPPASLDARTDLESLAMAQRFDVQGARLAAERTARSLGLTRATRFINVLEVGTARERSNEAPDKTATAAEKESWRRATELRKEWNSLADVKNFGEVDTSFQKIKKAAEAPSAAGDIALLTGYMKMIDPGSTVREGEFATAQNAGGVPDRIRAQYNKVVSGERLSSDQRTDFVTQAGNLYAVQKGRYMEQAKRYRDMASEQGLNPEHVTGRVEGLSPAAGGVMLKDAKDGSFTPMSREQADAYVKHDPKRFSIKGA